MVALAPNTSETSTWDVLDGFSKLHSRAREAKTTRCTEAPASKSLSRVEIWLVISESCVGLESFPRDPIGFEGGAYGIYKYCHNKPNNYMDPFGMQIQPPSIGAGYPIYMPAPHVGASVPKRCIFYANPFKPGVGGIDTIPLNGGILVPFTDQNDMIFKIMKNGCCEVILAGHQGGTANAGGVKGMINCQPYDGFGDRLRTAFKMGGCKRCSLFLAACGSRSPEALECRQELANDSGCDVFGSPKPIPYFDPSNPGGAYDVSPCTLDPKKVGTKCGNINLPDSKYSSWPFDKTSPVFN